MVSTARVPAEKPGDYIIRLCKHFAHKIPATWDDAGGNIRFEMGDCRLAIEPGVLVMEVEGADAGALDRLEDVVTRHLERFAWKEAPTISWTRGA